MNGVLRTAWKIFRSSAQPNGCTAAAGGSTLNVFLDNVQMHSNSNAGFAISGGMRASVVRSSATSNIHGFYADNAAVLDLNDCTSFGNVSNGVVSASGAIIRLSNTSVTGNGVGLSALPSSAILSYGTNRIVGNGTNGAASGMLGMQ
jgi:hypothetical protein